METKVTLQETEYEEFLKCLTNLKEECNDIDIREGIIRQRNNELTSVFELDMTSLLPGATLSISDLKKKLDILKSFSGQEEVVLTVVEGDPGYVQFSDEHSSVKFMLPTPEFMDNKYMSVEERDKIFAMDEEDLLLQHDFGNVVSDRIRIIAATFNVEAIQINFDGEEASVSAMTQGKDQSAKFAKNITTNIILENSSSNVTVIPFTLEHDQDIVLSMYKDPNQAVALNKFSTVLGDVDINVYARSSIVGEDDS